WQHKARMEPLLDKNIVCASLMVYRLLNGHQAPVPIWLDAINKGDTDLIATRTDDENAYQAALTMVAEVPYIKQKIDQDYKVVLEEGKKIDAEKQRLASEAIKKAAPPVDIKI